MIQAMDTAPEWTNIVRALKALGKWPKFTDVDVDAAKAEIEKFDRDEPNAIQRMKDARKKG